MVSVILYNLSLNTLFPIRGIWSAPFGYQCFKRVISAKHPKYADISALPRLSNPSLKRVPHPK